MLTDSYKVSHHPVYPAGTTGLYSYFESRGGEFPEVTFFGLQYILERYLTKPVTMTDIDHAESRFKLHFGDASLFNRTGWETIVNEFGGKLPVRIKAVPEGLVVPNRNVLITVENTDPRFYWLTNYLETILSQVWYPTTVATISREIKKVILRYLNETGDPNWVGIKLHDFGFRGVSSVESSAIGGAAHLVNFIGTDTMSAYELANDFYDEPMAGFSIPATEHSVMSALGAWGEKSQMERFLDTFGQNSKFPAIACVSDTYDIYRACSEYWGRALKKKILNLKNMLVVRPDSGIPHVVVVQVIETLDKAFGHTVNSKGYKVLNNVRVIQGDGVDYEEIVRILEAMKVRGWSTDNIAFGMGGALLQKLNRDTQKFAFKASAININGKWNDVQKTPVTDTGKRSKAGRMKLVRGDDGVLLTVLETDARQDVLEVVFENGIVTRHQKFSDIRALSNINLV